MEIFKGEEGEIYLNNKKINGILISKIIQKKSLSEEQIKNNNEKYFPDINKQFFS